MIKNVGDFFGKRRGVISGVGPTEVALPRSTVVGAVVADFGNDSGGDLAVAAA